MPRSLFTVLTLNLTCLSNILNPAEKYLQQNGKLRPWYCLYFCFAYCRILSMKQSSHLNFDIFDTVARFIQLSICAHIWSHRHCYPSLKSDERLSVLYLKHFCGWTWNERLTVWFREKSAIETDISTVYQLCIQLWLVTITPNLCMIDWFLKWCKNVHYK